jgi:ferritin-like metal-binding protein YciE
MKVDSFHKLYIHTLKDIYSAEEQITEALPKMIEAASNSDLKRSFEQHLEETRGQIERLDKIFESLEFTPTGERCEAMEGLIEEGEEIIENAEGNPNILDAGLIAAAQKVEHYEIAAYGTAVHYAKMLGDEEAASLLKETLNEEKQTDDKLNELAKNLINPQALESGEEMRPS